MLFTINKEILDAIIQKVYDAVILGFLSVILIITSYPIISTYLEEIGIPYGWILSLIPMFAFTFMLEKIAYRLLRNKDINVFMAESEENDD